jgi:hypothetical protein
MPGCRKIRHCGFEAARKMRGQNEVPLAFDVRPRADVLMGAAISAGADVSGMTTRVFTLSSGSSG